MASGVSRNVSRLVKGRLYSAAAAQAESRSTGDREPRYHVKKLGNGIVVASLENNSPVSRLAVIANAGSRFETGENLGISHIMRKAGQMRTDQLSALGIARMTQQLGSDLTILGTREYLYYKSNVARNCAGKAVEILQELTTKQVFKPWEVADVQSDPNNIALDLAVLKNQPHIRAMEFVHEAAFRDTLGRSLYAPPHTVGSFSPEQLNHFTKTYFSAGRLALIGVGIDPEELEELGSMFQPFASAGVPTEKAAYQGGEIRENLGGDLAFVSVAFEGPSLSSKDLLPSEVLKHILGTGPYVKYSSGTLGSMLGKAAAMATDSPFHVSSFNANYTDAGLFGFNCVAHCSQIEKVVRASANQIKDVASSVNDQEVAKAKRKLKAELCMQFENPDVMLNWLGEQALNSDQILTPQEICKLVDNVNASDVSRVAKGIVSSKPSMGSVGNISSVPYLDKLFTK